MKACAVTTQQSRTSGYTGCGWAHSPSQRSLLPATSRRTDSQAENGLDEVVVLVNLWTAATCRLWIGRRQGCGEGAGSGSSWAFGKAAGQQRGRIGAGFRL